MAQKAQIPVIENKALAIFQIAQTLSQAKNPDPAKITEVLKIWQDENAAQAKKDFEAALAEVKPVLPTIVKSNEVILGGGRGYQYEDLATISAQIDPILAQFGLNYRFHTSSTLEAVTVTCRLSHINGHSEETSLTAPIDKTQRSNIQGLGSSTTYLSRYTLKSALGLAAAKDDDANSVSARPAALPDVAKTDTINAEQIKNLRALLKKADKKEPLMCEHYRVKSVNDLLVGQYDNAVAYLEAEIEKLELV